MIAKSSQHKAFVLINILLMLILALLVACAGGGPPPEIQPPLPETEIPVTPPPLSADSDLVITSAVIKAMQGARYLEVTVLNQGLGLAENVEGVCSYECVSSGVKVSNQGFLQGGYLVANKSVNGLLGITPCSDASIYFICTVDPGNLVTETDESNNNWEDWVE